MKHRFFATFAAALAAFILLCFSYYVPDYTEKNRSFNDSIQVFNSEIIKLSENKSDKSPIEDNAFNQNEYSISAGIQKNTITEEELVLIAKFIHFEAEDEPYLAKVSCAAVIFNRLNNTQFPDDIFSIIFEEGEFNSISAGLILPSEDKNKSALTSEYNIDLRAAREAAKGKDPTNGALYFSRLQDNDGYMIPMFECGGMIFCN